ncbi:MAG: winged helix-turn-helix domain-containing protein [Gammaproteobacteria bacterium]|nr:winged helix-turn-helix domain-containing protein [Gammaproteobacteria bacterium]
MSGNYHFGGFRLDADQRLLFDPEGRPLNISTRAFDCLLILIENRGQTLSKNRLMSAVWRNQIVEENNLNQAIFSIRKALGDSKADSQFVRTVQGQGYCFTAEIDRPVASANDAAGNPAPADAAVDIPCAEGTPGDQHPAVDSRLKLPDHTVRWAMAMSAMLIALLAAVIGSQNTMPPAQASLEVGAPAVFKPSQVTYPPVIANSIAVLPFAVLNPTPEDDLFALGLHDELTNRLSKVSSLNVIARSSVLPMAERYPSPNELGRVLGVESVMTGTVFVAAGRARINLQLIDPLTGVTRWSSRYESATTNLPDIMTIQSDIAQSVASTLETQIQPAEQDDISAIPTHSFDAYRYRLAGKSAYANLDYPQALALAHQALALDPDYYDALTLLANTHIVLVGRPLPGMTSDMHYRKARDTADRMIAVAPEKPDGYIRKALAFATNKQWTEAVALYRKARDLNAPLSQMNMFAPVLMSVGDFPSAIEILDANLRYDPMNLFGRGFLMAALEAAGDSARARAEYRIGDELKAVWSGDTFNVFLALGRREPLEDIDDIPQMNVSVRDMLKHIDDTPRIAAAIIDHMQDTTDLAPADMLYLSAMAAYIGRPEQALAILEITLQDVWYNIYFVWLPIFKEVRQLPEFAPLLARSGLIEFWQVNAFPDICHPTRSGVTCK